MTCFKTSILNNLTKNNHFTTTTKHIYPESSRVIIIGGGVIGTSIAYHLGKKGWGRETILLEQNRLTSGTTWHAAGLVETFGSFNETSLHLRKYSRDLYRTLEQETGVSTGWIECGFIELAANRHYLEQFRRMSSLSKSFGNEIEEIGGEEIKKLFPLCDVRDILAGFYVKADGRVNPVDVTMSLAKGAKLLNVKFFEDCKVEDILQSNSGFVDGVRLKNGHTIKAEYVINATGMWARQLGEKNRVIIPNQAAEHYYFITEKIDEVSKSWPVIEDPSSYTYIRPEGDGLMIGLFETEAAPWSVRSIPDGFAFGELPIDYDRIFPFLNKAMNRVPISLEKGLKKFFCGPESFTPDLAPIIGESPEIRKYFISAGLNSVGILTGGGVGQLMANWIVDGYPDLDITGCNVDRFQSFHATAHYRANRVKESLGMVYKCHYPSYEYNTCRGIKKSPFHDRLLAKGAFFRDVSGWESPAWYASDGSIPKVEESSRTGWWERENWFKFWESEHMACRKSVVLIDMSFMSKFLVQGREAGKILNQLSTANIDGPDETIVYTQWLNRTGKVEADLTVMKMDCNNFMVVATDTAHRHVETLLRREIADQDAHAFVTDVSGAYAQINIQGPKSREFLQTVVDADLSHEAFPFRSAKKISIGYAMVTCARLTYVGELGYELYIPVENALHVYDKLTEADNVKRFDLVHCGLRALGSLRMEKGYRDYGHDIDNTDSVLEVGLGFTCDFSKQGIVVV
jgi:glycine cleavage system aminomethyltransferase T/glycine/D-amino acid oxidase-like deaminating enzyme